MSFFFKYIISIIAIIISLSKAAQSRNPEKSFPVIIHLESSKNYKHDAMILHGCNLQ
jgi:hypothetical protein